MLDGILYSNNRVNTSKSWTIPVPVLRGRRARSLLRARTVTVDITPNLRVYKAQFVGRNPDNLAILCVELSDVVVKSTLGAGDKVRETSECSYARTGELAEWV